MEAEARDENAGILPAALQTSTVATTRIENDHLVSTVRFHKVMSTYVEHQLSGESSSENIGIRELNDQLHQENIVLLRVSTQIESLSENIDIRELDFEWREAIVNRFRSNEGEYDESEDYLTTFTFPDNTIVFRYIHDHRQPNRGLDFFIHGQIIWNSRFTWRQIKQHLEDYTYNFHFRSEIIHIGMGDITEEGEISSPAEEEVPNSLRVAVDALPSLAVVSEESESSDGEMCSICHETFSSEEPAKELPCQHLYHSKCILLWLHRRNSCPMCRSEFSSLTELLLSPTNTFDYNFLLKVNI